MQKLKDKILATCGQKQVGKLVSAEKGKTITAVGSISASGIYIPPMLIFPRKNFVQILMKDCPTEFFGVCSPSGWINSDLFVSWLHHFVKHTHASKENKVLLILDNHSSQVSLELEAYTIS